MQDLEFLRARVDELENAADARDAEVWDKQEASAECVQVLEARVAELEDELCAKNAAAGPSSPTRVFVMGDGACGGLKANAEETEAEEPEPEAHPTQEQPKVLNKDRALASLKQKHKRRRPPPPTTQAPPEAAANEAQPADQPVATPAVDEIASAEQPSADLGIQSGLDPQDVEMVDVELKVDKSKDKGCNCTVM